MGGNLNALGWLDVDELRSVQAVAIAFSGVVRVNAEPVGPGTVCSLGADEAGDIRVTGPRQRKLGKLSIGGNFLDDTTVGMSLIGKRLRCDCCIFDENGDAVCKRLALDNRVDGAGAVFLNEVISGTCADNGNGCQGKGRHGSQYQGLLGTCAAIDAAATKHGNNSWVITKIWCYTTNVMWLCLDWISGGLSSEVRTRPA